MILWYRFLDSLQSKWNRYWKIRAGRKRWGKDAVLENLTRSGRRYSRVEFSDVGFQDDAPRYYPDRNTPDGSAYRIRSEPGWEWTCQNCKTYSIITESMMPAILKDWEEMAAKTVAAGYKPPKRPTAATAGCTNCRYLPGAPE